MLSYTTLLSTLKVATAKYPELGYVFLKTVKKGGFGTAKRSTGGIVRGTILPFGRLEQPRPKLLKKAASTKPTTFPLPTIPEFRSSDEPRHINHY